MKAIAIVPGRPETAGVLDMPEPRDSDAMTTALVLGKQGGIRDSKRRPPTLRSGGRGACEG